MFLGINMFGPFSELISRLSLSGSGKNKSGPKNIYAQEHKLFCFTTMQNMMR